MSLRWPKAGISDVGSYLISGIPFVLNGTTSGRFEHIQFPAITNFVTVKNTATGGTTQIVFAFTENGLNDNPVGTNRRIFLREGEERSMVIRIKELFVTASGGISTFDVSAGLTQILPDDFPTLTGSVVSGTTKVPPLFQGVG